MKLKWTVPIVLLVVVFIAVLVIKGGNVKQIPFIQQSKLQEISFSSYWEKFREELDLTENAKIMDFKIIYDKEGQIYKVEFDLIDNKDSYIYRHCFLCPHVEENKLTLIQNTSHDRVSDTDQYISGESFFNKLDLLRSKSQFLDEQTFAYYMIQSRGRNEGVALKGEYFELIGNELKKLVPPEPPKVSYEGFNLQIVGNEVPTAFGTAEDNTITVLLR